LTINIKNGHAILIQSTALFTQTTCESIFFNWKWYYLYVRYHFCCCKHLYI